MSRTMPTQCEHGEIVDWGDFGPCQGDCHHDDDCPNFPDCPDCMETRMTPEQTMAINDNPDEAVIEALLERFFWERIDTLTRLVWPNKKNREPIQASGLRIDLDAEPKAPHKHRALHLSYHGCTVSAGLPDVLADYMERERPFHRFLGLEDDG